MAKVKTSYTCTSCTYTSIKWMGCCPQCSAWDTFEEQRTAPTIPGTQRNIQAARAATVVPLSHVDSIPKTRLESGISEWDRVVGGGIMPGSLIVLTGDPGIGKSTLLLQISKAIAQKHRVFYFSTEESLEQVKQRAQRIGSEDGNLFFGEQAELGAIIACARQEKPDVLIIDSIQNCFIEGSTATPGSVSQLRESTFQLMRLAKEHGITTIITGHITKEGIIAGPKTLEHMVDAVFYLQGEDRWHSRVLRAVKNRFGTVNEVGFFEMHEQGLQEIPNINAHLIGDTAHAPGSTLVSVMEGSRPLLLELQALTVESKLTMPQRVITGIDHKQVMIIAAILQKYIHIKLSAHDIFFKISGGFKVKSSAADLGIALAILSSYFQQPLPEQSIALGEVSLTGTIKPINQIAFFVREAEKFGIKRLFVSRTQKIPDSSCSVQRFAHVYELLALFQDETAPS